MEEPKAGLGAPWPNGATFGAGPPKGAEAVFVCEEPNGPAVLEAPKVLALLVLDAPNGPVVLPEFEAPNMVVEEFELVAPNWKVEDGCDWLTPNPLLEVVAGAPNAGVDDAGAVNEELCPNVELEVVVAGLALNANPPVAAPKAGAEGAGAVSAGKGPVWPNVELELVVAGLALKEKPPGTPNPPGVAVGGADWPNAGAVVVLGAVWPNVKVEEDVVVAADWPNAKVDTAGAVKPAPPAVVVVAVGKVNGEAVPVEAPLKPPLVAWEAGFAALAPNMNGAGLADWVVVVGAGLVEKLNPVVEELPNVLAAPLGWLVVLGGAALNW